MPAAKTAHLLLPLVMAMAATTPMAMGGCSDGSSRPFGERDAGGDRSNRADGAGGTLGVGRPEVGASGSGGIAITGTGGVSAAGGSDGNSSSGGSGSLATGGNAGTGSGGVPAATGGRTTPGTGGSVPGTGGAVVSTGGTVVPGTGGRGTGGVISATGGRGSGGAGTGGMGTGGAGTGGMGTGGAAPPSRDGSTPERSGGSCREILAVTGGHTDGVYWIKPDPGSAVRRVFCDMTSDGGGWTMVFKLSDGLSGDAAALWNGSSLNENQVDLLGRSKSTVNYVSSIMAQNWNVGIFGVREVVLHFYVGDRLAAFAKFDGKLTTPKTWFEKNLLLASSWTDLTPTAAANYFGIVGDEYFLRHFVANQLYGNCPADVGWFVVSNGWFCAWETPVTQPAQALGPISLVYSNLSTATLWTSIGRGRADAFAVYVR